MYFMPVVFAHHINCLASVHNNDNSTSCLTVLQYLVITQLITAPKTGRRPSNRAMAHSPHVTGAELVAEALRALDVTIVFGIVGIPIVEIAEACTAIGIRFIAFRNEQSASYAAQAYGFLTGRPGVCLVVGGPGVVHAMAGIVNGHVNCWPILVIAGYIDNYQKEMGGFQELDQVSLLKPHTKFAAQPSSLDRLPFMLERAYRSAFYGRPGPTFVDVPANFIRSEVTASSAKLLLDRISAPAAPRSMASADAIRRAIDVFKAARSPLVVVGKGCAYAHAERSVRNLIDSTQLPFLPTPMGKGIVPDSHPLNAAAARSAAIANADVVLLLGARLNWMLHFGEKPKWRSNVKFIQVDISAEELGNNAVLSPIMLLGDVTLVVEQLRRGFDGWKYDSASSDFLHRIHRKASENMGSMQLLSSSDKIPMGYHRALTEIKQGLSNTDVVYVSEGANTMDIGRSILDVEEPRRRLDAGTFATMGVGMGYAIAGSVTIEYL
jgi:2-hydroxyacyl-CoA lyase